MPAECEFRPRRAVRTAWALLAAVWLGVAGLMIASWTVLDRFGPIDRVLTVVFAGVGSYIIVRQALVRAVPDSRGLTVRNLMLTTFVEWEQIVAVNFSSHRPWVSLDLSDGDTLAVMAIQSADGEYGQSEAQRLADLVAAHEGTDPVG